MHTGARILPGSEDVRRARQDLSRLTPTFFRQIPGARRSVRGFHVVTFEPGGHSWEPDGKQYVTITSGATGPYVMRAGDPNLANVPAGGSLWTFKLFEEYGAPQR